MKAKRLIIFITVSLLFCLTLLLASCGECTHDYGEWSVEKEATCTEDGLKTRSCKKCSESESEVIAAGHRIETIPSVAATCKKTGLTEGAKCSVCDTVITSQTEIAIDPDGHVPTVIPGNAPTCNAIGFSEGKKCSECNKTLVARQPLERAPHTPTVHPKKDATCTAWGYEEGTKCAVCNVLISLGPDIAPLDHSYNSEGVCTVCNQVYSYSDDLDYVLSEDETYYIVNGRGTCTDKHVVIPDTHNGLPVKEIAGGFYMDTDLMSIKIGNNVTKIGSNAFFCTPNLYYVILPDSVESIGECAFDFSTNIERLHIGSGLKDIDPTAFARCTGLKSIRVSEDNPYIKAVDNVIYSKDGKTLILSARTPDGRYEVLDGTVNIEAFAFFYSKHTEIVLPSSVEYIGNEAISRSNVTSIIGGENLKKLGYAAFSGSPLASITLGNNLSEIGEQVFAGTNITSITIPGSLKEMPSGMFNGCAKLTSITIEDGIKKIGANVFAGCAISDIVLPDSVESIGSQAFSNIASLKSITLGKGVSEISSSAFTGCTSLENIHVVEGNEKYSSVDGVLCLADKTTLVTYPCGRESIVLSAQIKNIGAGAFGGFTGTKLITIPDTIETLGFNAFLGCDELEKVILGKGVKSVDPDTFMGCMRLHTIEVSPENDTYASIDGYLTSKDKKVLIYSPLAKKDVVIPNGITVIGKKAFQDNGITSIVIPDTVIEISDKAFFFCFNLKEITLSDGLKSIGENAFYYCMNLSSVVIPESVEALGKDVFIYCSPIFKINCEADSQPSGWDEDWNTDGYEVEWGYSE